MNTLEKVISIIIECTENKFEISANTSISEDGLINSFDRLMIVNAIEDEFSIEFDEADFKKLCIVGDFATIIETKYLNPDK